MTLKRHLFLAAGILLIGTMAGHPAIAEEEDVEITMLAQQTANGVLTPDSSTLEMTFVIDSVPEGMAFVTSTSKTLQVSLIDPNEVETYIGSNGPGIVASGTYPEGAEGNPEIEGMDYLFRIEDPPSGTWTIRVTETIPLTEEVNVLANVWMQSEIQGAMVGGGEDYPAGGEIALGIMIANSETLLGGCVVDALVFRAGDPTFTPTSVWFADNGSGGDITGEDGLYTASVVLTEAGTYQVDAQINGFSCTSNGTPTACPRYCGDNGDDGEVDLDDLAAIVGCMTGPGGSAGAACQFRLDADADEDIDLADYAEFQRCFGQTLPPEAVMYRKALSTTFNVIAPLATLDEQSVTDEGVDLNMNGLIDQIVISVDVDSTSNGEFSVQVDLESEGGTQVSAIAETTLTVGVSTVDVVFDVEDIHALSEDGPYAITMILLEAIVDGEPFTNDILYDVGDTAAYQLDDLEREPIQFGGISDTPSDCDGDGDFDVLTVDLEVDVLQAGTYSYSLKLQDSLGREIQFVSGLQFLSVGVNNILIDFDGSAIGAHREDGPYQIGDALFLGGGESLVAFSVGTTSEYTADQFHVPPMSIPFDEGFETFNAGPDPIDEQMGWTQTVGVDPYAAVVSTTGPSAGSNGLEMHIDPALGDGMQWGVFSPMLSTACALHQALFVDVRIDATGGPNYDMLVQSPSEGEVVTRVNFGSNGTVSVFQETSPGVFDFLSTGVDWTEQIGIGTYFTLQICVDTEAPPAANLEIAMDDVLVFVGGTVGSSFMEQFVVLTDNTAPDVTLYVDNVRLEHELTRPDCNDNGIPDACDIAAGTSEDVNTNGIPDECEPEEPPVLYAVEGYTDTVAGLYVVDPSDGTLTLVGNMNQNVTEAFGLSTEPDSDDLYAVVEVSGSSTRRLAIVNHQTAGVTFIGQLSEPLADIAFRDDGTLYGIADTQAEGPDVEPGDIVIVDTSDGTLTATGINRGNQYGHSIAFQPDSGLLYHTMNVDFTSCLLETIDVDSQEVTLIDDNLEGLDWFDAITFHPAGLPLLAYAFDELYSIDPSNGNLTFLGSTGYQFMTGLSFAEADTQ